MTDVINEMSLKPAPAFLLGLINCAALPCLGGLARPSLPTGGSLLYFLLSWICSMLYIPFANAGMIQNKIGLLQIQEALHTHGCHVSVTLSLGLIKFATLIQSHLLSFPCCCNNLSGFPPAN